MSKTSRLEVIETGARRRWTPEEKLRIVAESLSIPRNVSATARRYGLSKGQLFTWLRLARDGKLVLDEEQGFAPAFVAPPTSAVTPTGGASRFGRIEIVLSEPRRLIVGGDVDPDALVRVIAVLERRAG
jgi:transposase